MIRTILFRRLVQAQRTGRLETGEKSSWIPRWDAMNHRLLLYLCLIYPFFFFLSSSCLSELCGLFDVRALAPQTYVWNVIHVLLIIANGTRRVITCHFKSKRKKQCIVSVTTTKSSKNIYCLDIYCDPRRRSKHIRFGIKFIQKKYKGAT